ncbi:hypothetical protein [Paractinoplanes durhamensis]|uniref:PKD domain-containing protein n=1 Tax=Paractinoplanes durhamensis TaxID=113563 RepID=A0ABQ3YPP0_9ACTN|nr:hypothetical protein [Actinoplanes durhamensis]GID99545.1 hypothetical protein Adu01nite_08960 [Actinoplanes durhamensis]
MKTRLNRPLLAAVLIGSLAAGTIYATPAFADPVSPSADASSGAPLTITEADPSESASTPTEPGPEDSTPVVAPEPEDTTSSAPDPEPSASDPGTPPDTTAPSGSYKLNLLSLWVGQRTTLTLGTVSDNGGDPDQVTRVVTWGDGTSTTLPVAQTTFAKQYTRAGRFVVTVTLTDAAGNKKVLPAVAVTVVTPGKFKLSKSSVWHHEAFNVAVSAVPAGTTKIVINYGDGNARALTGKNQTVAKSYYHRSNGTLVPAGTITLTAVFTNKYGSTTPIVVGRIAVKKDSWAPKVTITKPKNSSSAKAWSTLKGTATDKGSGVSEMIVVVLRVVGSKEQCYSYQNKWISLTNDLNILLCLRSVKVKKNKWSLGVKGQKKGSTIDVLAVVGDWSDRTGQAEVMKKLTKA